MLGPLVATYLDVGFVAMRKAPAISVRALASVALSDGQVLALDFDAIGPGDRVLLVDDVIETGEQARAARRLVEQAGAEWVGMAVVVAFEDHPDVNVKALITWEELR
jgi:adenine phosphoribosyltransferase